MQHHMGFLARIDFFIVAAVVSSVINMGCIVNAIAITVSRLDGITHNFYSLIMKCFKKYMPK